MGTLIIDRGEELRETVEEKLTALMLDLESANWPVDEIAIAIHDVLRARWLNAIEAQRDARTATSGDFVSDGNEG